MPPEPHGPPLVKPSPPPPEVRVAHDGFGRTRMTWQEFGARLVVALFADRGLPAAYLRLDGNGTIEIVDAQGGLVARVDGGDGLEETMDARKARGDSAPLLDGLGGLEVRVAALEGGLRAVEARVDDQAQRLEALRRIDDLARRVQAIEADLGNRLGTLWAWRQQVIAGCREAEAELRKIGAESAEMRRRASGPRRPTRTPTRTEADAIGKALDELLGPLEDEPPEG